MRKNHIIIIFMFTLFLSQTPFLPNTTLDDGEGLTHLPSSDSSVGSGASEEENIDSFDVSPASGRWNVTSDDLTDDLVTDSILRMTTVNNETSASTGFAMDRGMRKTDGKVEYRMAASGGGNQTEFFRDVIGDKSDFDEGDDEGWTAVSGGATSIANGILIDTFTGNDPAWGIRGTLSFSMNIYHTLELKIKGIGVPNGFFRVEWIGTRSSKLFTVNGGVMPTEWTVVSVDLPASGDWSNKLVTFDILFGTETTATVNIDYIKFIGNLDYATHIENEIEDTWDWEVDNSTEGFTGLLNMNVSEGFLRGTMVAATSDLLNSPANLNIDTDLFNIFIIRLNTSDVTMSIIIQADLGAGFVSVSSSTDIDSTSQTIYIFDLSDFSDWDGTCIRLRVRFDELDGDLDGDEIIYSDYVLLLGHWADSDSVIGLWDQDDLVPLLNVSSHFTSNNSHPTTSEKAYFTVELLDLDGDIAYSAISENYTDISDLWIRGKIQYDVLRSRLIVTINVDNLTRIDKWTFPGDFTEVSGRIPALFSLEKSPYIFISTFCVATSWQEMKLDYIKADYTERQWIQTGAPTDTDWLVDTTFGCNIQDDIVDSSNYTLVVPSLDYFSASLRTNFTNLPNLALNEHAFATLYLLGVDGDDGDLHKLFQITITLASDGGGNLQAITTFGDSGTTYYDGTPNVDPRLTFTVSLVEERTKLVAKARFWHDIANDLPTRDWVENVTIADIVTDPSQEFVFQLWYHGHFSGDAEFTALWENFEFVERDIFSDIVDAIVQPLGTFFQQIFVGLFRFFAGIFKAVGDLIIGSIITMQTVVTAAINNIQGWLVTLGTTITNAVNQIQGWLTTLGTTIATAISNIEGWLNTIAATIASAIDQIEGWLTTIAATISDAIADIAADIWTAFGTAAADIMDDIITALTGLAADVADFIDGVIQFLIPLLLAIAADLADLLVGIIDALITIGGDILEGIMNFIAGVVFFIWEELGLPDVLAVIDLFISPIVEIVTGLPTYVTEIGDLIAVFFIVILGIYWFWLIFLAFAEKGFDIFAGFGESVSRLFTFWNLTFFGIGPIPIPIALFFIPLTYFMVLPSGSVFAIW